LPVTLERMSSGSRLSRALKRLSASADQLQADELQARSGSVGCQQIHDLSDREVVTVFGHLKTVSLAPRAGTPTLEASLYDGSGAVTLVWLGRRQILGIKPGVSLIASGRVSCQDGRRIMFNPRYELQV
jgi:hypothetical protein